MHVALAVLVKNECKTIERCLRSVLPCMDSCTVHDTGSTDNTVDLILEFFEKHPHIPLTISRHPFTNYGESRNRLFADVTSRPEVDYVMLLDADMELKPGTNDIRRLLTSDVHTMVQKDAVTKSRHVCLIRATIPMKYVGSAYEYVLHLGQQTGHIAEPDCHIVKHHDGGCRVDKFERAYTLLQRETPVDKSCGRYNFCLADALKNLENYSEAIKYYTKFLENPCEGDEMQWYAMYMVAKCHLHKNEISKAEQYALKAFDSRPTRVEPLYMLVKHYREHGDVHKAWSLCLKANAIPYPMKDTMFIEYQIYTYSLPYEISILAFYAKEIDRGMAASNALLLQSSGPVPYDIISSTQKNVHFYMSQLAEITHMPIHPDPKYGSGWNAMNPCVHNCGHDGLAIVVRHVNYLVSSGLQYSLNGRPGVQISNENPIETKTSLARIHSTTGTEVELSDFVSIEIPPGVHHKEGNVQGVEDIRMVWFKDECWFLGTTRSLSPNQTNSMVLFTKDMLCVLSGPFENRCEKNWLPFVHDDCLCFLYSYEPFVVAQFDCETKSLEFKVIAQPFVGQSRLHNLRGSAAPVKDRDGNYLFVVHEVLSDRDYPRRYVHRFCRMDSALRITGLSFPFFLSGAHVIEYVAGMAMVEDTIYISWGEGDARAYISTLPYTTVTQELNKGLPSFTG